MRVRRAVRLRQARALRRESRQMNDEQFARFVCLYGDRSLVLLEGKGRVLREVLPLAMDRAHGEKQQFRRVEQARIEGGAFVDANEADAAFALSEGTEPFL